MKASFKLSIVTVLVGGVFFAAGTWALLSGEQNSNSYNGKFAAWMDRYAKTLDQFDNLVQHPELANSVWRGHVDQQLADLIAISAEMHAYQPDFSTSMVHQGELVDIADNYTRFANLYRQGIATNDPALLAHAQAARATADRFRQHDLATFR